MTNSAQADPRVHRSFVIKPLVACVLLFGVAALFWQVKGFSFINFDDNSYVTENPIVRHGLTPAGVKWAFTSVHSGNWHPLTSLSHMADCHFYNLDPSGHHFTNLALHAVNAALLFLLLNSITGSLWRSATVAVLFAVHPLRVESVAWVSERKDVLSGLFFFLTLWAYSRYAATRDGRVPGLPDTSAIKSPYGGPIWTPLIWYGLTLLLLSLGLMSKPMLVTVPFVLLLLDYWPLGRWSRESIQGRQSFLMLWVEKIPFFLLAGCASVVTLLVQNQAGAVAALTLIPPGARLSNAVLAYVRYLQKLFWPENLAVLYPYALWPTGIVLAATAGLVLVTLLAIRYRNQSPSFMVGWFWYLGTLVPVIGLIQVGEQSMADRYTYLPSIGILIVVVWNFPSLLAPLRYRRELAAVVLISVLAALVWATHKQLGYWKDGIALFSHAVAATKDNPTAHRALGSALLATGQLESARLEFEKALQLNSADAVTQNNIGVVLSRLGKFEDALKHYQYSVELNPNNSDAHFNLGNFFNPGYSETENSASTPDSTNAFKDSAKASLHYEAAVKLNPDDAASLLNWGILEVTQGRYSAAAEHFSAARRIDPDNPAAHANLARCLTRLGKLEAGLASYIEAVRLEPANPAWHRDAALLFTRLGEYSQAVSHLERVTELLPAQAAPEYELGRAWVTAGRPDLAIPCYRAALKVQPDWVLPLNDLAWILATHENPELRNGNEAVILAQRACAATTHPGPSLLGTLDVAYAEAGEWAKAIETAQLARQLAIAENKLQLAEKIAARLKLYGAHRQYRDKFLPQKNQQPMEASPRSFPTKNTPVAP